MDVLGEVQSEQAVLRDTTDGGFEVRFAITECVLIDLVGDVLDLRVVLDLQRLHHIDSDLVLALQCAGSGVNEFHVQDVNADVFRQRTQFQLVQVFPEFNQISK